MKLAIVCGGKPQLNNESPLKYVSDSVQKIVEVLEKNNWKCIPFFDATTEQAYKKKLTPFNTEDITDFLFYYIGHGRGDHVSTFEILFKDSNLTFEQIKLRTKEAFSRKLPQRMAVVVDACYSGNIIDKSSRVADVEVLTSSDRDTESFEKIMPDGKGWTEFSYYFYQIFNASQETPTLNLEQIGTYISADEQSANDTFYLPNPSQRIEKIIIGNSKEIHDICQRLEEQYSASEFKEKVLTYYITNTEGFHAFVKENNFKKLFDSILKNKPKILYCIFHELGLSIPPYLKEFSNTDCSILQEKATKSRMIQKIILQIESKGANIESCTLNGWCIFDSDNVKPLDFEDDINFNKQSKDKGRYYKDILYSYLSNVLQGMKYKTPLELQLILSIHLFKINFSNLKIELRDKNSVAPYGKRDWGKYFDISYRFIENINNIETDSFVINWKTNSKFINEFSDSKVDEEHMYKIDAKEKREIIEGFNHNDQLVLVSNYRIIKTKYLKDILEFGIPMVISPKSKENICVGAFNCQNVNLHTLKQNAFNFVRDKAHDIHFINDNYCDLEFLNIDCTIDEDDYI